MSSAQANSNKHRLDNVVLEYLASAVIVDDLWEDRAEINGGSDEDHTSSDDAATDVDESVLTIPDDTPSSEDNTEEEGAPPSSPESVEGTRSMAKAEELKAAFEADGVLTMLIEWNESWNHGLVVKLAQKARLVVLDLELKARLTSKSGDQVEDPEKWYDSLAILAKLLATDEPLRMVVIYTHEPGATLTKVYEHLHHFSRRGRIALDQNITASQFKPDNKTSASNIEVCRVNNCLLALMPKDKIAPEVVRTEFATALESMLGSLSMVALRLAHETERATRYTLERFVTPYDTAVGLQLVAQGEAYERVPYLLWNLMVGEIREQLSLTDMVNDLSTARKNSLLELYTQVNQGEFAYNEQFPPKTKDDLKKIIETYYPDEALVVGGAPVTQPEKEEKRAERLRNIEYGLGALRWVKKGQPGSTFPAELEKELKALGSVLMTVTRKNAYKNPRPGDIFQDGKRYLLCITPACDAERLTDKVNGYVKFVVGHEVENLKAKVNHHITVLPLRDKGSGYEHRIIRWDLHHSESFKADQLEVIKPDSTTGERRNSYVATLRDSYIQQIINKYGAYQSRVGVEEYIMQDPDFLDFLKNPPKFQPPTPKQQKQAKKTKPQQAQDEVAAGSEPPKGT